MAIPVYRRNDEDLTEMSDINVTPFIDVMLVLLIIFMVAAPLSTVDVAVDLPTSTAVPQPRPDKPLYLTLKTDLSLTVGNVEVAHQRLGEQLDQETDGDRQRRVFLRADQAVPYGEVMNVMNLLRGAGYQQVALVGLEGAPAEQQAPRPSPE